jgi:hypothetical protein
MHACIKLVPHLWLLPKSTVSTRGMRQPMVAGGLEGSPAAFFGGTTLTPSASWTLARAAAYGSNISCPALGKRGSDVALHGTPHAASVHGDAHNQFKPRDLQMRTRSCHAQHTAFWHWCIGMFKTHINERDLVNQWRVYLDKICRRLPKPCLHQHAMPSTRCSDLSSPASDDKTLHQIS